VDRNTPEPEEGASSGPGGTGALSSTPKERATKGRRVKTDPPPGSDPNPAAEPERHAKGENDERMRGDKPPHY